MEGNYLARDDRTVDGNGTADKLISTDSILYRESEIQSGSGFKQPQAVTVDSLLGKLEVIDSDQQKDDLIALNFCSKIPGHLTLMSRPSDKNMQEGKEVQECYADVRLTSGRAESIRQAAIQYQQERTYNPS